MYTKKLEGKKVAIIIARQKFRDEEYLIPKEILEKEGHLLLQYHPGLILPSVCWGLR